jgi:glutamate mutase epsilon subunit
MECEELIHPLIDTIVSAAVASGWAVDEALIAVEEAVKDIRAAKPAAG